MAIGFSDAFPRTMLSYASGGDIKLGPVQRNLTVILPGFIVDLGNTVDNVLKHFGRLHATLRIMLIPGAVRALCVSGSWSRLTFVYRAKSRLITCPLSDNNLTGSGTTDVGNRLL